jgi:hypothetical protein
MWMLPIMAGVQGAGLWEGLLGIALAIPVIALLAWGACKLGDWLDL